jgi:hypothetical protein
MAEFPKPRPESAALWTDLHALRFLHAVAERGLLQFDEDNVSWGRCDVLTVVLLGCEPTGEPSSAPYLVEHHLTQAACETS